MPVTLRDILALEAVRAADPTVIYGDHLLDRAVRWVHTSELAEAAALLRGGELLLTTGLGLVGRGPVAYASYIDDLADHSAAALALELGWSFSDVPEPLAAAAARRDLPLVALRSLVPFVEITEAAQSRILAAELSALRAERDARGVLDTVLRDGGGLAALVAAVADHTGAAVSVETFQGRLVAHHAVPPRAVDHLASRAVTTTAIELDGGPWGWLHLYGVSSTADRVAAIRDHASAALALVLARDHPAGPLRATLARELLADLVAGDVPADDVQARIALAEPALTTVGTVVAVAVGGIGPEDLDITLHAASRVFDELGANVLAAVDGTVLALIGTRAEDLDELARRAHERIAGIVGLRHTAASPTLATGAVGDGLADAGRVLATARTTSWLLADLDERPQAASVDAMAGARLIDKLARDPDAALIVAGQLGPLMRYDRNHGTELVRTLATYLGNGSSKTALADILHLRRQTLYKRLARIEELIGPVDRPDRRATLLLALQILETQRARLQSRSTRPS